MKRLLLVLALTACTCILNALNPHNKALEPDTIDICAHITHLGNVGCAANILPEQGAKLNYTQIMFEHVQISGASEYLIEIISDEKGSSFDHPLVKQKSASTAILISDFKFGENYIWRYTGLHNGKELGWQGPYNFEIPANEVVDPKLFRARVLQNDSTANSAGLIILDVPGNAIDRNGNLVWYLPKVADNDAQQNSFASIFPKGLRSLQNMDVRITPFGTVTLLNGGIAEERDLRGNLVWMAPPRISLVPDALGANEPYSYHHCFEKLSNGNYLAMDRAIASRSSVPLNTPAVLTAGDAITDTGSINVAYEILKEFNKKGELVWSWSSENYFDVSEWRVMARAKPDAELRSKTPGGHMNAFYADEKNGFIYAGFRNISRIIKIDKKTGQVVCSWGGTANSAGNHNGQDFFVKQHGLCLLHDGSIAVFNNDTKTGDLPMQPDGSSSVIAFSQTADCANSQITFKFNCNADGNDQRSTSGGNIDELKNGNLLVDMGNVNMVFEITRDKKIVWSAMIESCSSPDYNWHPYPLYRAHYASSLYPCYFTIQTSADTLNNGKTSFSLQIFNDGTEDDSYQVTLSSLSNNYQQQFSATVQQGKKSQSFKISPSKTPNLSEPIKVSVISKTNPDFIRTAYVQYNK